MAVAVAVADDARRMVELLEPIHAVNYFSAEAEAEGERLGYAGFWMAYVAFRSAPLGEVPPAVVTASFFGFHPSRVLRALPEAWARASPTEALLARERAAALTLRRCWDERYDSPDVREAATLACTAATRADTTGRVLAAANQALPWPDDPALALWAAAGVLREHRGDGHNAVLVALSVSPVQAHLIKIASGTTKPDSLRTGRNWPDEDWAREQAQLQERGWLDEDARLTSAGASARDEIERLTDEAATQPWTALDRTERSRLQLLLEPLVDAIHEAGAFPTPNPIGFGAAR